MRAAALTVVLAAAAALAPAAPAAAQQLVTSPAVRAHLQALDAIARANGGNRAAGTPGEAATVDYVARASARRGGRCRRRP